MTEQQKCAVALIVFTCSLAALALILQHWELGIGTGIGALTTLRTGFLDSLARVISPCADCADKGALLRTVERNLWKLEIRYARAIARIRILDRPQPGTTTAPEGAPPWEGQNNMFNLFSQLFGSKKGHTINSAVDTDGLPILEAAVPGAAPAVTVTALTAHPAGSTGVLTVTTTSGDTFSQDIEIAGKVLLVADPNFPEQLDGVVNALGAKFGPLGVKSADWLDGYLNAKLETIGFNAPTVIVPPTSAAA